MLLFSINRSRGYENPSLDIIVTERCSIGGCPLEEACEHCYLIQSAISVAISYIISVYCEDYAGYFTVILSFLAFHFCSAYFIYLVSCTPHSLSPKRISPKVNDLLTCVSHESMHYKSLRDFTASRVTKYSPTQTLECNPSRMSDLRTRVPHYQWSG
jgi:hypothetical protein